MRRPHAGTDVPLRLASVVLQCSSCHNAYVGLAPEAAPPPPAPPPATLPEVARIRQGHILKISGYNVITCCLDGQNYTTVKIETDDGVYGLGDATLAGRELAVVAYLTEHVLPTIIGRDAFDIEDLWQYMYRAAYWRGGPVSMTAISAVDVALWDIKGKALEVPVYNLLGGHSRRGIRAYAHAWGESVDETVQAVANRFAEGYTAIRFSCAIPGLPDAYRELNLAAPSSGDARVQPPEEVWDTRRYLDFLPKLVGELRKKLGPDPDLLHDVHHRLTGVEATWLAQRLEPFRLYWLEDPIRPGLADEYTVLRQRSAVPLAVGETFHDAHDCYEFVTRRLIDHLRMSPSHSGGLTNIRKIGAFAEIYKVAMACHGPIDISPVGIAAAAHFGISSHNYSLQEHVRHGSETAAVLPHSFSVQDGYLHPGDKPGLGVDLDECLASRFPFQANYLPVVRTLDGTVRDW